MSVGQFHCEVTVNWTELQLGVRHDAIGVERLARFVEPDPVVGPPQSIVRPVCISWWWRRRRRRRSQWRRQGRERERGGGKVGRCVYVGCSKKLYTAHIPYTYSHFIDTSNNYVKATPFPGIFVCFV